jgi:alkylhydroperoxidase/carboxymuconolactone decarboxylase family protein YurZ
MPAIQMVEEDDATAEVTEIYGDIKSTLGIDFVPNMYKLMAPSPSYLEANWHKVKAVMVEPGELDRLTREIIAVAVSATNSCEY